MSHDPAQPGHRAWDAAAVPRQEYDEIARALTSADSPVGIDAKRTHVLILHALDRLERRLEQVGAGAAGTDSRAPSELPQRLKGVPAFAALDSARCERLAHGLERLATVAAGGTAAADDFPAFVAELIGGVFDAQVDASVKQMEAYADLVEGATSSLDDFVEETRSGPAARSRQQLLATMVLMGVNRIEITRGRIRVTSVFDAPRADEEEDDDD